MGQSDEISAEHDLYEIHILDENGVEYQLQNNVTVTIPVNGDVAQVLHFDNGLEPLTFEFDDDNVSFSTDDFSKFAVVYTGTAAATPTESDDTDGVASGSDSNGNGTSEEADGSSDSQVSADEIDSDNTTVKAAGDAEVLPNTGIASQNTIITAAALLMAGLAAFATTFFRRRNN